MFCINFVTKILVVLDSGTSKQQIQKSGAVIFLTEEINFSFNNILLQPRSQTNTILNNWQKTFNFI